MKGARQYVGVFEMGLSQFGKLAVYVGQHARGATIQIFVLPDDTPVVNVFNAGGVEVYGVVGGQVGWTECYGWKHKGPWQEDFERIVFELREKKRKAKKERDLERSGKEKEEAARAKAILDAYRTNPY